LYTGEVTADTSAADYVQLCNQACLRNSFRWVEPCDFNCFLMASQSWVLSRLLYLLAWTVTNVGGPNSSWRLCVFDWCAGVLQIRCAPEELQLSFHCFCDSPESVCCEYGSYGERIFQWDGSSRGQFNPSCDSGSGAYPLHLDCTL